MRIGYDAKRIFHNNTGLGNYSRDLVRVVAEYYSENEYYLYNPKPKKVTRLELTPEMTEVLPTSFFWKKLSSIWRQGPVVQQIQNDGIELYHGLSGEIPRGIQRLGIKTVVTIHDLIFLRYPNLYSHFDRKMHTKKFQYAATHADRIIAISEQTKNDIIEFLEVDAAKIEVVYQGCHAVFKTEKTVEQQQEVQRKYKLPERFILNVGTIEPRKNALQIVKAIKDIDTNLVIVGRKTAYYQEIQSYIGAHELQEKVYFLEGLSLQELAILYSMADLFVYPSIFEGFGIPIIEALYAKTPVITTQGGVFPEAGGPSSMYVDPEDTIALQKAITVVLSSEEKRKEMREKGYTFVQKFNDDVIAKNVMRIYKQLL